MKIKYKVIIPNYSHVATQELEESLNEGWTIYHSWTVADALILILSKEFEDDD